MHSSTRSKILYKPADHLYSSSFFRNKNSNQKTTGYWNKVNKQFTVNLTIHCFVISVFVFWGRSGRYVNFFRKGNPHVIFTRKPVPYDGRIFSRKGRPRVDFSWGNKKISRGGENREISFYPLETKKTNILLEMYQENVKFQNAGDKAPLPPSDTHAPV